MCHPENHGICKDCYKDCFDDLKDYYTIKHHLWNTYGVGKGMLCMDCMEKRLGHKLYASDILICPLTTEYNPYTISILKNNKT